MRKVISWFHFLACVGWIIFLITILITQGLPGFKVEVIALIIASLLTPAAGVYLFIIGRNKELTKLKSIEVQNKILQAKLDQSRLEKELSEAID